MIEVEVGGTIIEFPDDTPYETIKSVSRRAAGGFQPSPLPDLPGPDPQRYLPPASGLSGLTVGPRFSTQALPDMGGEMALPPSDSNIGSPMIQGGTAGLPFALGRDVPTDAWAMPSFDDATIAPARLPFGVRRAQDFTRDLIEPSPTARAIGEFGTGIRESLPSVEDVAGSPALAPVLGAGLYGAQRVREEVDDSQFVKGVIAGLVGTNVTTGGAALEGLGHILGNEGMVDTGRRIAGSGEEGAKAWQPRVRSYRDVGGLADALAYLGYSAGQGLASMAPGMAVGVGVGALTANPIAGFVAGAAGPSFVQNYGDIYSGIKSDPVIQQKIAAGELTEREAALYAAAGAIPMAALDTFSLGAQAGAALRAAQGELRTQVIRRVALELARGSGVEGVTEGLQEVISQATQAFLGDGDWFRRQRIDAVIDNTIGGAATGGLVRGAGIAGGAMVGQRGEPSSGLSALTVGPEETRVEPPPLASPFAAPDEAAPVGPAPMTPMTPMPSAPVAPEPAVVPRETEQEQSVPAPVVNPAAPVEITALPPGPLSPLVPPQAIQPAAPAAVAPVPPEPAAPAPPPPAARLGPPDPSEAVSPMPQGAIPADVLFGPVEPQPAAPAQAPQVQPAPPQPAVPAPPPQATPPVPAPTAQPAPVDDASIAGVRAPLPTPNVAPPRAEPAQPDPASPVPAAPSADARAGADQARIAPRAPEVAAIPPAPSVPVGPPLGDVAQAQGDVAQAVPASPMPAEPAGAPQSAVAPPAPIAPAETPEATPARPDGRAQVTEAEPVRSISTPQGVAPIVFPDQLHAELYDFALRKDRNSDPYRAEAARLFDAFRGWTADDTAAAAPFSRPQHVRSLALDYLAAVREAAGASWGRDAQGRVEAPDVIDTERQADYWRRAAMEARGAPRPAEQAGIPPSAPSAATASAGPTLAAPAPQTGIVAVDPATIGVDPVAYQFKADTDAQGVSDRLQGVTEWDPIRAGVVIVHERADGSRFIADGHQRLALARRVGAPSINAYVLREADGVTVREARAIAALKNIAEGTGTALDVARVVRSVSPRDLSSLPPNSALVRDGKALAQLSNDAFGIVVNGVVPMHFGAIVGRAGLSPEMQVGALQELARTKPENAAQAQFIVNEVKAGPVAEGEQTDMLGTQAFARPLIAERARILDAAVRRIKADRATFRALVERAGVIAQTGNQLATDANRARVSEDEAIATVLSRLSDRRGPVADALNQAARDFAGGRTLDASVRQFLEAARQVAPGTGGLRGDPRGDGPAREGGPPTAPRDDDTGSLFQRPRGDGLSEEAGRRPVRSGAADGVDPAERFQAAPATAPVDLAALKAELRRLAPLAKVEMIDRLIDPRGRPANAAYLRGVVQVAMTARDPMNALRHEAIHALRDLNLIRPEEWRRLEAKAKSQWLAEHRIAERYPTLTREQQIEEGVAEAFAEHTTTPLPAGFRAIYENIKRFFERLGAWLRGQGFQTVDDVLGRIESGEVGRRVRQEPTPPRTETSYGDREDGRDDAAFQSGRRSGTDDLATRIAGYARAIGYEADIDRSRLSESRYVTARYGEDGEPIRIRISNHDAKPWYGAGDIEVSTNDRALAGHWSDAVRILAERANQPMPAAVRSVLTSRSAEAAANVERDLSEGRRAMEARAAVAATDARVREMFPDEWAAAEAKAGEARREAKRLLRRRAESGAADAKATSLSEDRFQAGKDDLVDTSEFRRWFRNSVVVDEAGNPLVVYHATTADIEAFDRARTADGGFHFGTSEQANMRSSGSGRNVVPAYLSIESPRRSKDAGGNWRSKIEAAKSAGHDGIVYLNRYEGIPREEFEAARAKGIDLDAISDAAFRRAVPSARDSYIAFRPEQIKSTLNRGTFDASDKRIQYQAARPGEDPAASPTRRSRTVLDAIRDGQPIDRLMRLPFRAIGGIDERGEWKPGQRLADWGARVITEKKLDPDGPLQWLNPAIEKARAGLIDRYGQDPEYTARDRARQREEAATARKGLEIVRKLVHDGMDANEAKVLQAVLTGEQVDAGAWAKVAEPIRAAIDELGDEAAALGLISRESYERNKGSYLHRVYLKHEATPEGGKLGELAQNMGRRQRAKFIGSELKGRGIFIEIDAAEVHPLLRTAKSMVRVLDDARPDTTGTPKNFARAFVDAGKATPDKYEGWTDRGAWEVRQTGGGKIVLWRDYTPAERQSMGEILDSRYTIAKTFYLMAHDLATGRFYQDIAQNEAWATKMQPAEGTWANASESWMETKAGVEWVKVPDTAIPDTGGVKKWGALSGMYVRSEIWRDLNQVAAMAQRNFWDQFLTQWKLMKTARNPGTHMNNVMSNVLFMDMNDVRLQDLVAGIRSYMAKDQDFIDAEANGAFGTGFVGAEIKREVLEPILKEIEAQATGRTSTGPVTRLLNQWGMIGRLMAGLGRGVKAADQKMLAAYRAEDDVFRMALYKRRIAMGDSPLSAADAAREVFLDYDIRAPWINAARRTVLPFIAYPYRAIPGVAKALAVHPWKLAKYAAIAQLLNWAAYQLWPGDEEEERRNLRKDQRGYTWVASPRMLRLWTDSEGANFLDIRRWIPAGDIFDTNQGQSVLPLPGFLQVGGPLATGIELLANRSLFTGQDIINEETDDPIDRAKKLADYAWKSWAPSAFYVPGSWYWSKMADALGGARDRITGAPLDPAKVLASSIGIKIQGQDLNQAKYYRQLEHDRIKRELSFLKNRTIDDHNRGALSDSTYRSTMDDIAKKEARLDEQNADILKDQAFQAWKRQFEAQRRTARGRAKMEDRTQRRDEPGGQDDLNITVTRPGAR